MSAEWTKLMELADWAARLRLADVPAAVRERAGLVLLDLTGANLAGSRDPGMDAMARALARRPGKATLVGTPVNADPAAAALFNGTATVALELDEGNQFARAHPGAHVWPAVLAAAEEMEASGEQALVAFLAGYEVAARVGVATQLLPSVHPHGTAVAVGAAAGLARLWGYSGEDLAAAVTQAASLAAASPWEAAIAGATVRNLYTGTAMQNAFVAAESIRWGLTHNPGALGGVFGGILGRSFDPGALTADLGQAWYVARGYFKIHACCQYNHSTLDAVVALLRRRPFMAAEVDSILVETYGLATKLSGYEPASTLGAKFSIPHAVATAIVLGETGPEAFGIAHLHNPDIRSLSRRVRLVEDEELTRMLPRARPSRVTVQLKGGEKLVERCDQSRGMADHPFTEAELRAKFVRLAGPVLGTERAQKARGLVQHLSDVPGVTALSSILRADWDGM